MVWTEYFAILCSVKLSGKCDSEKGVIVEIFDETLWTNSLGCSRLSYVKKCSEFGRGRI